MSYKQTSTNQKIAGDLSENESNFNALIQNSMDLSEYMIYGFGPGTDTHVYSTNIIIQNYYE